MQLLRRILHWRFTNMLIGALVGTFVLTACLASNENDKLNSLRKESISQRYEAMKRGMTKWPFNPANMVNFPIREALIHHTYNQDQVKPWYIYIQNYMGEYTEYFVAQTSPISTCAFLGSTEDIIDNDTGASLITTAPSLDAVYYGGAGSADNCTGKFFFDYTTGAEIIFASPMWRVSDQPLPGVHVKPSGATTIEEVQAGATPAPLPEPK